MLRPPTSKADLRHREIKKENTDENSTITDKALILLTCGNPEREDIWMCRCVTLTACVL